LRLCSYLLNLGVKHQQVAKHVTLKRVHLGFELPLCLLIYIIYVFTILNFVDCFLVVRDEFASTSKAR
jgi:hypothetical protein